MTDIEKLSAIARRQRALFAAYQAGAAGVSPMTLTRLVHRGVVERVQPSVYGFTSSARSWRRDLTAAVLAVPGLVVAGRSALMLWGVPSQQVLEFAMTGTRHPRLWGNVIVHRASDLMPEDVVFHQNLPVTTPARSLLDSGLTWKSGALRARAKFALDARLASPDDLQTLLERVGRHGRTGAGRLRLALALTIPDVGRSELELLARRVLSAAPVEFVEQQTIILPNGREIRPDFTAVGLPLLLDVHGYRWHSTPAELQKDSRRRNAVTEFGWTLLEYTWTDLKSDPARVLAEITRVVQGLRRSLSVQ